MRKSGYLLVLLSVLIMVFGQVMSKKGAAYDSLFNVFVALGYMALLLRAFIWVLALRKLPLSFAYPALSISFILVFLVAFYFFNEPLTANKVTGSLLIITGVVLISIGKAKEESL